MNSSDSTENLYRYISETQGVAKQLTDSHILGSSIMQSILGVNYNSPLYKMGLLKTPNTDNQIKLIEDEASLKVEISKLSDKLYKEKSDKNKLEKNYIELEKKHTQLEEVSKKRHVLSRVSVIAGNKLLESVELYEQFSDGKECQCVVMSIDIRRSTELMLKAKEPKLFSKFITGLSILLSECIKSNFGIFDKFTGDGILAFFPKFYSSNEALVRALKAAEECHLLFKEHYNNSKSSFNVYIKDIGLGIGIDYGQVTLVNTSNELTVVGIPVVYACRFSGANAGDTLLNISAKEEIEKLCGLQTTFTETELYIKNEGTALAYKVDINKSVFEKLKLPQWLNDTPQKESQEELENPVNE